MNRGFVRGSYFPLEPIPKMLVILSEAKSRYIGILDESGNLAVEMLPCVQNDILGRGS